MHQCIRNILFSSLLLRLVVTDQNTNSLSVTLKEIFNAKHLKEKLKFLVPQNIFEDLQDTLSFYKDNQTTISDICSRDLGLLEQALVRRELWALQMLDASSKVPSGILQGNIIDFGMFDECVASVGQSFEFEVRGHHCMYTISVIYGSDFIFSPQFSICIPSTCTANDMMSFINNTINKIDKLQKFELKLDSVTCSSIDQEIWSMEFIVCLSIFIIFMGFLIISSVCDIFLDILDVKRSNYPLLRFLGSFSLQKSVVAIFSTEVREGTLSTIHGIRFLSMAWVVLGHRYISNVGGININRVDIPDWVNSWKSLYIFIAPFAVDTFFAISGLVMAYVFFKQIPKQNIFNIPMYYLHRYLRITPPIIALIVFTIVFKPKIGSGPRWEELQSNTCRRGWWSILFFIQNFMGPEADCLQHLWYLAVDMQLYWMSPIILYPLYKKPKIGLAVLGFLFLVSLAAPAIIIGINKYPISSYVHKNDTPLIVEMFNNVYQRPYNRAAPWIIGIIFGFDIVNKNRRLSKLVVCMGWLLTMGSFAFCTFGTKFFMDENYEYNIILETFFATVSRPFWGFGICWIIYASHYNYAGVISTFLSWKAFLPLSRLSYCVYLVHIIIQNIEISLMRTPRYFSDYESWLLFTSDLILSLGLAFIFSLLFESPVIILEKFLFKRKRESQQKSQNKVRSRDEEYIRDKKF